MRNPRVAPGGAHPLEQLFDAALADHRAGRLDAAAAKYAELLRRDPRQADASHLLGQIAFARGDAERALELVRQAIARNRKDARYLVTLALMLNRLGRAGEAEETARRALRLDSGNVGAYVNLAIAFLARDAPAEAERALARALDLSPDDPVALSNMGTVQRALGRPADAARYFRRAVEIDPKDAVAWANLAESAHETERAEEATAAAERAIALDPLHAPAHATLGMVRLQAGAVEDAVACCERAVALRPRDGKFLGNLAVALLAAGRPEAALATHDRQLAERPADAKVLYNKAICQLLMGALDAGLENYEARWDVPSAGFTRRGLERPAWTPDAPADARVLIWSEQGVGDHLFNASFLPALRQLGVHCIYECDSRLARLIERSFPDVAVVPVGDPAPEHDYQIPAGSLLRALRARLGTVRATRGWLRADPGRVAAFRDRLATLGPGPWLGISWRSARALVGPHKSMPLAAWGPVLALDARFVNLQYGDTDAEIAAAAADGIAIHSDPDLDRFNDIDGLAALIDALDGVVTTSNVTAHIAGALGRPTWVALQKVPLWYWGLAGDESRYYPSLHLVRQSAVGEWHDVARRIAVAAQQGLGASVHEL